MIVPVDISTEYLVPDPPSVRGGPPAILLPSTVLYIYISWSDLRCSGNGQKTGDFFFPLVGMTGKTNFLRISYVKM